MDKKWIEKDDKLSKTYNDMAEKNGQFKEKYPTYNKFCEEVSPSYKATIEQEDMVNAGGKDEQTEVPF